MSMRREEGEYTNPLLRDESLIDNSNASSSTTQTQQQQQQRKSKARLLCISFSNSTEQSGSDPTSATTGAANASTTQQQHMSLEMSPIHRRPDNETTTISANAITTPSILERENSMDLAEPLLVLPPSQLQVQSQGRAARETPSDPLLPSKGGGEGGSSPTSAAEKRVYFQKHRSDKSGPLNRSERQDHHIVLNSSKNAWYVQRQRERRILRLRTQCYNTAEGFVRMSSWIMFLLLCSALMLPDWRRAHFCCQPYHDEPLRLGLIWIQVPYPNARDHAYPGSLMSLYDPPESFRSWKRGKPTPAYAPHVGVDWENDAMGNIVSNSGIVMSMLCVAAFVHLVFNCLACTHRSLTFAAALAVVGFLETISLVCYHVFLVETSKGIFLRPAEGENTASRYGYCFTIIIIAQAGTWLLAIFTAYATLFHDVSFARKPNDEFKKHYPALYSFANTHCCGTGDDDVDDEVDDGTENAAPDGDDDVEDDGEGDGQQMSAMPRSKASAQIDASARDEEASSLPHTHASGGAIVPIDSASFEDETMEKRPLSPGASPREKGSFEYAKIHLADIKNQKAANAAEAAHRRNDTT